MLDYIQSDIVVLGYLEASEEIRVSDAFGG